MEGKKPNRYSQIIERVFDANYVPGSRVVTFERVEIEHVASDLGVKLPKNLGDVVYSFRYRTPLPQSIRDRAPAGESWIIFPAGISKYKFLATDQPEIRPDSLIPEIKIADSTPGVISKYAMSDEQALLAKLRYNRLIDIFTGVTCYSLQNHLRTTVTSLGQVETDEIYIGVDKRGVHYVFPVQAKGGSDILSIVQIGQDTAMCAAKFPGLVCRPIAAQFIGTNKIALFSFKPTQNLPAKIAERHYVLVQPEELSEGDLAEYLGMPDSSTTEN
jgi:hypothetical protein